MSLGAPLAPSSNCASGPPFARRDTRRGWAPEVTRERVVAMHNPIYCSADHTLCGRLRATAAWVGTLFAGGTFWSGAAEIAIGRAGKIREGIRDDHRD